MGVLEQLLYSARKIHWISLNDLLTRPTIAILITSKIATHVLLSRDHLIVLEKQLAITFLLTTSLHLQQDQGQPKLKL